MPPSAPSLYQVPRLSRRAFLRGCAAAAASLGLSQEGAVRMVEAAASSRRPSVIWLHFQECTGCSEALLRASHPDLATLILHLISLDYHETVMAGAGAQAEAVLAETLKRERGRYICVVEGAVPTKDGGVYCKIGGRTALEIVGEVAPGAAAVVAVGTCASFGGIQAAAPNPTGAKGVGEVLGGKAVVNVPGCPPNPISFLGTLLHLLTFKRLPEVDALGRPLFAYGRRIHDHCERRPHFDEGRYAERFGGPGHRRGFCLYKLGCKGPSTYSNCPSVRFNDVGVWPVACGHGCVGCTEPDFWDTMTPFYQRLPDVPIPGDRGIVSSAEGAGKTAMAVAGAAVAAHAAVGLAKRAVKGRRGGGEE